MDLGLTIRHDPHDDSGLAGGLSQLGLAGAATLAERFFGTGTPSPQEAARARAIADLADLKARSARAEAQQAWPLRRKQAHNQPLALRALREASGSHAFARRAWDRPLADQVHAHMLGQLHQLFFNEPTLRSVTDDQAFDRHGFVWRGPSGPDPQARPNLLDLDLGRGGAWRFNRVHDSRRPPEWREAYAAFFEGTARLFVLSVEDAGIIALEEAYAPHDGGGLARFHINPASVVDALGADNPDELLLRTPQHGILDIIKSASVALRQRDVGVFKEPVDARCAAVQQVAGGQYASLRALTRQLHAETQENTAEMALRLARRAGTQLLQANDDISFAVVERDRIRRASQREAERKFVACRREVATEQGEINEDAFIAAGASSLSTGSGAGPAAVGVQWLHKTIRARRKTPVCRDAIREHADNGCMKRVLPRGVVQISSHPDVKTRPDHAG